MIIKDNNNFLVTNHRGKLYFKNNMVQGDHVLFSPNGFTPCQAQFYVFRLDTIILKK